MPKPNIKLRYQRFVLLLSLLISGVFVSGLLLGTIPLPFHDLINFFAVAHTDSDFIIKLRMSRELLAFCCGGMLATGSALLQTLTRNSMIAPDLTGMTSIGCLLVVAFEIFFFKSAIMNEMLGMIGAILGFLLCFTITKNNYSNHHGGRRLLIVLTGIIISFTATAFMQLLILHAPQNVDDYFYFLTGSLYAINPTAMFIVVLASAVFIPLTFVLGQRFVVFLLDDDICQTMGIPIKRYWILGFLLSALLIGSSLVGIGNMGFLGIVAPNLARLVVGNRPGYVLPLSFLIGSFIYLLADLLGRLVITPAEISAGIMTNMITAPLFLYVLFQFYRGQHEWH